MHYMYITVDLPDQHSVSNKFWNWLCYFRIKRKTIPEFGPAVFETLYNKVFTPFMETMQYHVYIHTCMHAHIHIHTYTYILDCCQPVLKISVFDEPNFLLTLRYTSSSSFQFSLHYEQSNRSCNCTYNQVHCVWIRMLVLYRCVNMKKL
jgi:hypothetical protein